MWNQTHNIFYLYNVYADILKVMEKHGLTYGDWDALQNLLEYGIDSSTQKRSEKHTDLMSFRDEEPPDLSDYDLIKYNIVVPQGKYPIFDNDDYFIKNPYAGV